MSRVDKIPGLQLWWDADDASTINEGRITPGGQISTWRDKIGGYILRPRADALASNFAPTYSVGFVNGRNSVYFGYYVGADYNDLGIKRLTCADATPLGSGTYSLYVVHRFTQYQEGRIRPNGTKVTAQGSSSQVNQPGYDLTNGGAYMHLMSIYSRGRYQGYGGLGNNGLAERNIYFPYNNNITFGVYQENSTGLFVLSQIPVNDRFTTAGIRETGDLIGAPGYGSGRGSTERVFQYPSINNTSKVHILTARSFNDNKGSGIFTGSNIRYNYTFKDSSMRHGGSSTTGPTNPAYTASLTGPVRPIVNPILCIGSIWPGPVTTEGGLFIGTGENTRSLTAQWGYSPFEGHFCEFIFYDRNLTDAENRLVTDYLKRKWLQ